MRSTAQVSTEINAAAKESNIVVPITEQLTNTANRNLTKANIKQNASSLIIEGELVPSYILALESVCQNVNYAWESRTISFSDCKNSINADIAGHFGRKANADDLMSLLICVMSIIEGFSPSLMSAQTEMFIAGFLSVIAVVNDRKNYNAKFAELAGLQNDFIQMLQQSPELLSEVRVNLRTNGKFLVLTEEQYASSLQHCWESCSEMQIKFNSGHSISLQNLDNHNNRYAQFSNTVIAISWMVFLINLVFKSYDLSKTESADINQEYANTNRALTIMAGMPYAGAANWATTVLLKQEASISNLSSRIVEATAPAAGLYFRGSIDSTATMAGTDFDKQSKSSASDDYEIVEVASYTPGTSATAKPT